MEKKLYGFTTVNWSDHKFADYLRKKDKNWKCEKISEGEIGWNAYLAHDRTVAVVKFKNSTPIDRCIWIRISEM
jgi:hypothetical protein